MADDEPNIQDELDKASIEQLHKVVLQIGGNCFELKKLCATVLVGAGTLVATFTDKTLDLSFFMSGIAIVVCFWILDAQSYYYQEKIRAVMKAVAAAMAKRHSLNAGDGVGMPIAEKRAKRTVLMRATRAALNASMLFYGLVGASLILLLILFKAGIIKSYRIQP